MDQEARVKAAEAALLAAQEAPQQAVAPLEADPRAFLALGEKLIRQGERPAAEQVLQQLIALAPGVERDLAHGRLLRALGRPGAAIAPLAAALAAAPERPETHIAHAMAHFDARDLAQAVAFGRAGLAQHPKNLLLRLNTLRAQAALDAGSVDLAELDQLIAAGPKRAPAHRLRLTLLRRLQQFEAAHRAVEAFAASLPGQVDGPLERAGLYLAQGELGLGAEILTGSLEADPPDLARLRMLGKIYGAGGDEEGLVRVLAALQALPPGPERAAEIGRVALLAGDREAAIEAFGAALAAQPDQPVLWAMWLEELIQMGRGAEAIAAFASAPPAVRAKPEVAVKLLNAHWAVGQPEAGIAAVEALGLEDQPLIIRHLSQTEALVGQGAAARARLEAWEPQTRGDQATREIGRAVVARWEYDFQGLERHARAALALEPNRAMAEGLLAHALLVLQDPDGAQAAQTRLTELVRAAGQAPRRAREVILWAIAEEMQLDPELSAALAEASRAGPEALRERAAAAMRRGYDQTGPAMALLVALRQLGQLELPPAAPGPSPIPAKIFQYWEGAPPPPDLQAALDRMRDLNPESAYRRFSYDEAWSYIAHYGDRRSLRAFELAQHAAERADIFRLVLLLREGGIYVDADDLCRGSLRNLLPEGAEFVVYQEYYGTIGNNLIATLPGNPVLEKALASAVEETLSSSAVPLWLRTGPGLMTRWVADGIAARSACDLPPGWAVLRQSDANAHLLICAPFSYKADSRHWIKASRA